MARNSVCRIAEFDWLEPWVLFTCQGDSEGQTELR